MDGIPQRRRLKRGATLSLIRRKPWAGFHMNLLRRKRTRSSHGYLLNVYLAQGARAQGGGMREARPHHQPAAHPPSASTHSGLLSYAWRNNKPVWLRWGGPRTPGRGGCALEGPRESLESVGVAERVPGGRVWGGYRVPLGIPGVCGGGAGGWRDFLACAWGGMGGARWSPKACGCPGDPRGPLKGAWKAPGTLSKVWAASWNGNPPLRTRAVWRSPKEPAEEGVGGLDSFLGLRHQLHRLSLLPCVVHVDSRGRLHKLLPSRTRLPRLVLSQRRGAQARRAACRKL